MSQRGSVLLLFPAATMVMMLLAAVTIDVALVQLRVRELEAIAAAAANDALAAVDVDALRQHGDVRLDERRAQRIATDAIAHGSMPDARLEALVTDVDDAGRLVIDVTLTFTVDLVMTPAIADYGSAHIRVTERAIVLGSESF